MEFDGCVLSRASCMNRYGSLEGNPKCLMEEVMRVGV